MDMGKLQITPLGGLGQFGMNITAFRVRRSDDHRPVRDDKFPDEDLLGSDIAIPDLTYIEEHRDELVGIVLTHALPKITSAHCLRAALVDVPIYATPIHIRAGRGGKLQEFGLLDKVDLRTIKQRQKFTLGPFEIEFIHVSHSLIECVALAIRTPVGVIVHTGDFKIHDTTW